MQRGVCKECSQHKMGSIALGGLGVFLAAGLFHWAWNRKAAVVEAIEMGPASVTLGQTIVFLQIVGVVAHLTMDWPEALHDLFDVCQMFLFQLNFMEFSCVVPETFVSSYLLGLSVPWLVLGMTTLWFLCANALSFATRGVFPKVKLPEHLNTLGMMLQAFCIGLAANSLTIAQSFTHPNAL